MRAPTIHLDAVASAFVAFLAVYVLMRWFRPVAGAVSPGPGRILAWDVVSSAVLCLAGAGCLVTSAFIETFGESRLPTGLFSALRGLGRPAVAMFIVASCLNLQKSRWLLRLTGPIKSGRFAMDVIMTGALFLGLQAAGGWMQPWTLVSDTHLAIYSLLFAETGWMWFARRGGCRGPGRATWRSRWALPFWEPPWARVGRRASRCSDGGPARSRPLTGS